MPQSLLIRGGRLVDPVASIDALRDIRVSGIVLEIGEHLEAISGEQVVDANGAIVSPGFIDMHVHLREPGEPQKERIETGTQAALRGGFTAIACMPNTSPALDDRASIESLLAAVAQRARCRVYPIAAITRGREGEELCDLDALSEAGAVAFSDDGGWTRDARVMAEAAKAAAHLEAPLISHCEPEEAAAARDLLLALVSEKRWHLAHLSTRRALEMLLAARAQGARVSAEVTPHHLLCTQEGTHANGISTRVNPPLRREDDTRALREGVRDGAIDVLASDHAPHTAEEKKEGAPGFSGLEVAVGAYAAALPDLPLSRFVALLSANPARILNVEGGTLQPGRPADVTIFRDEPWRVDASSFVSLGTCTPFDGATLPRRVIATIVGGEVRYRA